jgi:hypothetical protein
LGRERPRVIWKERLPIRERQIQFNSLLRLRVSAPIYRCAAPKFAHVTTIQSPRSPAGGGRIRESKVTSGAVSKVLTPSAVFTEIGKHRFSDLRAACPRYVPVHHIKHLRVTAPLSALLRRAVSRSRAFYSSAIIAISPSCNLLGFAGPVEKTSWAAPRSQRDSP